MLVAALPVSTDVFCVTAELHADQVIDDIWQSVNDRQRR